MPQGYFFKNRPLAALGLLGAFATTLGLFGNTAAATGSGVPRSIGKQTSTELKRSDSPDASPARSAPSVKGSQRRIASKASGTSPWSYVLPVDHGVRSDASGNGHFRAVRQHGEHNGIDLLAPVGTPVYSSCRGRAISGSSASFGRWVRVVCPVPRSLIEAKRQPYASIFYAHLDTTRLPHNQWVPVERGKQLGTVGKTGNASGPSVQPHLHLELIIQDTLRAALDEQHRGRDQHMVSAARNVFSALESRCLVPHGFQALSGNIGRARRADPFLVLTCLSANKPAYQSAPERLEVASTPWSELYRARAFNVNAGPRSFLLATR